MVFTANKARMGATRVVVWPRMDCTLRGNHYHVWNRILQIFYTKTILVGSLTVRAKHYI